MSTTEKNQEIIGFKVIGEKFDNLTEFKFWDKIDAKDTRKNIWISLIYGKNSIGKSSICKIIQNSLPGNYTYKKIIMYENNNKLHIDDSKIKIDVFNEQYIEKHVKKEGEKLLVILPDEIHEKIYNIILEINEELNYIIEESKSKEFKHILNSLDFFRKNILENYIQNEKLYNKESVKNDTNRNWKIITEICENHGKYHFDPVLESKEIKKNENEFHKMVEEHKNMKWTIENQEKLDSKNILVNVWKYRKQIFYFKNIIETITSKFIFISIQFEDLEEFLKDNEKMEKIDLVWLEKLLKNKIIDIFDTKIFKRNYYELEQNDWISINKVFMNANLFGFLNFVETKKSSLTTFLDSMKKRHEDKTNAKSFTSLDIISDSIGYILRSDHNLKFSIDDGTNFKLDVNEKTIQLNNLSTGEKNIVALVYFFVSSFIKIVKYLKTKEEENNTFIILIDDPVSSFDYEYKENLCSYIVNQLSFLLMCKKKQKKTNIKVAMFTHDISAFSSIKENMKSIEKYNSYTNFLELEKDGAKKWEDKELIYTKLIQNIYDFTTSENNNPKIFTCIGNKIRRVLEFFLKYSRNKNHEYIRSNNFKAECKEKLKSEKFYNAIKFTNLIKFLNNESHQKSDLMEMKLSWNDTNSSINYKSMAEEFFSIIHVIDNEHIKKHLTPEQDKTFDLNIEKWIKKVEEASNQTQHDILGKT